MTILASAASNQASNKVLPATSLELGEASGWWDGSTSLWPKAPGLPLPPACEPPTEAPGWPALRSATPVDGSGADEAGPEAGVGGDGHSRARPSSALDSSCGLKSCSRAVAALEKAESQGAGGRERSVPTARRIWGRGAAEWTGWSTLEVCLLPNTDAAAT